MHKRELLAQTASPAIATLVSHITTTKRRGFNVGESSFGRLNFISFS